MTLAIITAILLITFSQASSENILRFSKICQSKKRGPWTECNKDPETPVYARSVGLYGSSQYIRGEGTNKTILESMSGSCDFAGNIAAAYLGLDGTFNTDSNGIMNIDETLMAKSDELVVTKLLKSNGDLVDFNLGEEFGHDEKYAGFIALCSKKALIGIIFVSEKVIKAMPEMDMDRVQNVLARYDKSYPGITPKTIDIACTKHRCVPCNKQNEMSIIYLKLLKQAIQQIDSHTQLLDSNEKFDSTANTDMLMQVKNDQLGKCFIWFMLYSFTAPRQLELNMLNMVAVGNRNRQKEEQSRLQANIGAFGASIVIL